MILDYTIFADRDCQDIRQSVQFRGTQAADFISRINIALGREARVGVKYPEIGILITRFADDDAKHTSQDQTK